MARIIISTAGSSGDINPFIALGKELHARGHELVFAVPEQMADTAAGEGFAVHLLPTPTVEDEQRYAQDVIALPFAPFSAIYPRCAAVIHHGGIGTMAQALRAGVPMLVVPWGFDQFFSGAQLTRIGAGRWMRWRSYTVEHATKALSKLLQQRRYRTRTQTIAAEIAREDGVGTFCDQLEVTMTHPQAVSP